MNNKPVKPTEKQLALIRSIEDVLGYRFDFRYGTKEEASKYISAYIDEYNRHINKLKMYFENDWAITNGY